MPTEGATIVIVEAGDDTAASIEAALRRQEHGAALTLCARQHGAAIGRLCMALVGSQADAEDLTQETLLAAHDAFDSWRGEGSIRSWLFGIARRKCARHLESRSAGRAKLELIRDDAPAPDPADAASERQLAARARQALADIKPSEREALILRYAGGLSFREVAAACGIDEAAARKRVSRAHARLREQLDTDAETAVRSDARSNDR
ncbi:MAG TPA: RNA polymerase sigma factor [Polyangia bacterium]|jgi:RNA polymerase sigma-70 factor (ECF subfamily)|nr:RNA polymerase sigma factor [Polyangia bacterium]